MPMHEGDSMFRKLGDKLAKAADAHKNDPVESPDMGLPAGISGGIASLVDCRFQPVKEGGKNAGEFQLYAAGTVCSPEFFEGHRIQGLRTSILLPMFARGKKTFEEAVATVQNQFKLMGITDPEMLSGKNLESTARTLQGLGREGKIHFRFRTWKGNKQVIRETSPGKWQVYQENRDGTFSLDEYRKSSSWATQKAAQDANPYADGREPLVNHVWGEKTVWNGEVSPTHVVTDNTPAAPPAASASPSPPSPKPAPSPSPTPAPDSGEQFSEFGDLDSLAKAADADDSNAQEKLNEMAAASGVDGEAVRKARNWVEVAALISGMSPGSSAGSAPEGGGGDDAWCPAVEELYGYSPINPKTRRPGKRIQVEITAVQMPEQTVNIKSSDNPKQGWKGVPWDKLEEAP